MARDDDEEVTRRLAQKESPPRSPAISKQWLEELKSMFRMSQEELSIVINEKDFIAASKGQLVPDTPHGPQPKKHTIIEMEEVTEAISPPVTPIREPVRQQTHKRAALADRPATQERW